VPYAARSASGAYLTLFSVVPVGPSPQNELLGIRAWERLWNRAGVVDVINLAIGNALEGDCEW
jgi:predicted CoA-binding protein